VKHTLVNSDSIDFLVDAYHTTGERWDAVFADPPDNIGLGYDECEDRSSEIQYHDFICNMLDLLTKVAPVVWWSFNAKHTMMMGSICWLKNFTVKPCVQTFTFGQYNKHDFGNNHRPLWRISRPESTYPMYPESVKVPSWRQLNGDSRAKAGGRVPGDVFDFPRVTGNSKQRRAWHPTQLHEDLVERCLKSVTVAGQRVLDPFGGTGTTLRVAKKLALDCTLIEMSSGYCDEIQKEHPEVFRK
jgi:DNA modification methylase